MPGWPNRRSWASWEPVYPICWFTVSKWSELWVAATLDMLCRCGWNRIRLKTAQQGEWVISWIERIQGVGKVPHSWPLPLIPFIDAERSAPPFKSSHMHTLTLFWGRILGMKLLWGWELCLWYLRTEESENGGNSFCSYCVLTKLNLVTVFLCSSWLPIRFLVLNLWVWRTSQTCGFRSLVSASASLQIAHQPCSYIRSQYFSCMWPQASRLSFPFW